jgi:hypothetical protein
VLETEVIAGQSWRQVTSPDGVTCWTTAVNLSVIATVTVSEAAALIAAIPGDLSIPDFLKRTARAVAVGSDSDA